MCLKTELFRYQTVIECLKSILVRISDTYCKGEWRQIKDEGQKIYPLMTSHKFGDFLTPLCHTKLPVSLRPSNIVSQNVNPPSALLA